MLAAGARSAGLLSLGLQTAALSEVEHGVWRWCITPPAGRHGTGSCTAGPQALPHILPAPL
jgi:hypothetical protein